MPEIKKLNRVSQGAVRIIGVSSGEIRPVHEKQNVIIHTGVTYEELPDKPSINSITLVGNKTMTELLSNGLIINGGDSTGYDPPVVPTGVPDAEGVMF